MESTCPAKVFDRFDLSSNNDNRHRSNTGNIFNRYNNNNNTNSNYRNRNRNHSYGDSIVDERNTEQNFVDTNHLNDGGDSSAIIIGSGDITYIDGLPRSKVSRSSSTSSSTIVASTRTSLLIVGQFFVIFVSFVCLERNYWIVCAIPRAIFAYKQHTLKMSPHYTS